MPAMRPVHVPKSVHGFRFHPTELSMLENLFVERNGVTPKKQQCEAIVDGFNHSEPRRSSGVFIKWKQIKTWFENRRQKDRRFLKAGRVPVALPSGFDLSKPVAGSMPAPGAPVYSTNGQPAPYMEANRDLRNLRRSAVRELDNAWEQLASISGSIPTGTPGQPIDLRRAPAGISTIASIPPAGVYVPAGLQQQNVGIKPAGLPEYATSSLAGELLEKLDKPVDRIPTEELLSHIDGSIFPNVTTSSNDMEGMPQRENMARPPLARCTTEELMSSLDPAGMLARTKTGDLLDEVIEGELRFADISTHSKPQMRKEDSGALFFPFTPSKSDVSDSRDDEPTRELTKKVEAWHGAYAPILDDMRAALKEGNDDELRKLILRSYEHTKELFAIKEEAAATIQPSVQTTRLTSKLMDEGDQGILYIGDLKAETFFSEISALLGNALSEEKRNAVFELEQKAIEGERAMQVGVGHLAAVYDKLSSASEMDRIAANEDAKKAAAPFLAAEELRDAVNRRGGLEMLVRGADRLRLQIIEKLFFEVLSPRESVQVLLGCADRKNRLRIIDALLNAQLGPKLSPGAIANLTLALRKDDEKKSQEKAFSTETIAQFGWGRSGSGLSRMADAARELLDSLAAE